MPSLSDQRALQELDRELAALPVCAWAVARQESSDLPKIFEDRAQARTFLLELDEHHRTCANCRARLELIRQADLIQVSLPMRTLSAVVQWGYRRPLWLQPALFGAAIMVLLTILKALFAIGRMPLVEIVMAIGAAGAIGAGAGLVGGNAYAWLKPRASGWGPAGPYLAGLAFTLILGLATSLVLMMIPATRSGFLEGWAWIAVGVVSLVIAPILGHFWFRPKREGQGTT